LTEHFLTLSIESGGKWFHLARYHDFNRAEHGPEALAHCLGLRVDGAFASNIAADGDASVPLAGSLRFRSGFARLLF